MDSVTDCEIVFGSVDLFVSWFCWVVFPHVPEKGVEWGLITVLQLFTAVLYMDRNGTCYVYVRILYVQ